MNLQVNCALVTLLMASIVHSEPTGRIVGGFPISIEAVPYQVSLQRITYSGRIQHFCGGSIISPKFIVTASHCVNGLDSRDLVVLAGTSYIDQGGVIKEVKNIIMNERYDPVEQDFDIALIELSDPLEFSESIQPIAVPSSNKTLPDNTMCVVSGWGSSHSFLVFLFDRTELRAAEVPIIGQTLCQKNYGRDDVDITPRMLCAGYERGGKDSCQGDSGGPLACQQNGTTALYGIVSWGNDCAEPYFPGVYSRVQAFTEWIHEKTGL